MPNRRWLEPDPIAPAETLMAVCDNDPLVAQILAQRGFTQAEQVRGFLDPTQYTPAPPDEMPDCALASRLLKQAVETHQSILIWGDFDVDGQTSTALLLDGLRRLGAEVTFYIPNRITESHGIKVSALRRELEQTKPHLLLTCDTGVTEFEAVQFAREQGCTVIITDHHELAETLPAAHAVVNPRRLPHTHPMSTLPGVGVAFILMQHLFTSLDRQRDLPLLLDLVALGIVGDVAMQTADTRYWLQRGLEQLRQTGRIGLQALIEVARIAVTGLSAEQIGFQIAPRLNAAGRLGDARLSVELLTTRDRNRAAVIAQQLEGLNAERRHQTRQIEAAAHQMIIDNPTLLREAVLVLYQPQWHAGLVGIVANSLAERYGRPVVLLAGEENGLARGSARAPAGYDIYSVIHAHVDLLRTFGGHTGAAGLSLEVNNIDKFRVVVSNTLRSSQRLPDVPALPIDFVLTLDQVTLDLAGRLSRLAPFGEGNPRIVAAAMNLTLTHAAIIGREAQHRKLTVQDADGHTLTLLWWESAKEPLPDGRFDVAFHLSTNSHAELEAMLVDWRLREAPAVVEAAPALTVYDWRAVRDPLAKLNTLDLSDALVWAEAYPRKQYPLWKRRAELAPAATLIVLTAPSDNASFLSALHAVQPHTVHLFAADPLFKTEQDVLRQLLTAATNVIDHLNGVAPVDVLCGAVAQSVGVVSAGLELLAAEGKLGSVSIAKEIVRLTRTDATTTSDPAATVRIHVRFREALAESHAYRRFYRTMPLDTLNGFTVTLAHGAAKLHPAD
ncbi:MAG: single-stranded-DNA-specific exonuclease RecJ [Anaerolineae bacterium]|nr:single-stranded-DNA-specific exonuclease RecJ [Anaerolineae bacterium]